MFLHCIIEGKKKIIKGSQKSKSDELHEPCTRQSIQKEDDDLTQMGKAYAG